MKFLTSVLLVSLFFMRSASANPFPAVIDTNVSGLVVKDLVCTRGAYYGRWVNRNDNSLHYRSITIEGFDRDGDRIGDCGDEYPRKMEKMDGKSSGNFRIPCSCSFSTTVNFIISEGENLNKLFER